MIGAGTGSDALIAWAVTASREALAAAEALAIVWASREAVVNIPHAAKALGAKLRQAKSATQTLTEHLDGALALAQVLQESIARGPRQTGLPETGRSFPWLGSVEPEGDSLPETRRSLMRTPTGTETPHVARALAPRAMLATKPEIQSMENRQEYESRLWSTCWAGLQARGWRMRPLSGTGGAGAKVYFPPHIDGVRRRVPYYETRLQVLLQLREYDDLTPEARALLESLEKRTCGAKIDLPREKYRCMPKCGGGTNETHPSSSGSNPHMTTKVNPSEVKPIAKVKGKAQHSELLPRQLVAPPRMGCALAEWRARELLQSGCKINDREVLHVLEAWRFRPNKKRVNVMPEGVSEISSDMLGLTRVRIFCKFVVAQRSQQYPHVTRLLCQFFQDNPPAGSGLAPSSATVAFPFTTICVNKNYAAKRHRDRNNVGLSVIRALGQFTGGKLRYWPNDNKLCALEDLQESDSVLLNVQGHSTIMKSTQAHQVEPFEGTRYSLVYFSVTSYERASPETREQLAEQCGIDLVPYPQACKMWAQISGE